MIVFHRVNRRQPVKLSSLIIATSFSLAVANAHAEPPSASEMVAADQEDLALAWQQDRQEKWRQRNKYRREYRRSTGLRQIKAPKDFGRLPGKATGSGVTVAIHGGGIDAGHPDLDVRRRSESSLEPGVVDAETTAIAGIIAAKRDGRGVRGVAYEADLIDLEGARISAIMAAAGFTSVDERKDLVGFPTAASNLLDFHADDPLLEADIIQVKSFSESPDRNTTVRPTELALDRGKIVVFGIGDPDVENFLSPAFVVNATSGSRLLVAAVDRHNNLSSTSNRCGGVEGSGSGFNARDACLVAPGDNIRSTSLDGRYDRFSSSDIAAAHVTGAAAVVRSAFPGVSSEDVTNRLLTTATDLGEDGVDDVYGHGLLNLKEALKPQGDLCIATTLSVDGPNSSVAGSTLSFGSGFALGGSTESLVRQAVSFDAQGFPYQVDLSDHITVQGRSTGLDAFVSSSRFVTTGMITPDGKTRFALSRDSEAVDLLESDPYRGAFLPSDTGFGQRADRPTVSFASDVGGGIEVFMGLNDSSLTDASLEQTLSSHDGLFFQPGSFLAPYDQLADEQTGGGASLSLGDATKLTLSAFASTSQETDAPEAAVQKAELSHVMAGDVELRLGYGWLDEQGSFLGGETEGAFGSADASSQFFSASLLAPLSEDMRLFGAYARGRSSLSTGNRGLIGDWSSATTESFGLGVLMDDLAETGDRLSMMVGQPMRVEKASANLSVPTGRTEDGQVLTETRRVDLAPTGREIALEATYQFALDDEDMALATGVFVRLNPDHDPNADPDVGIGFRYRLTF